MVTMYRKKLFRYRHESRLSYIVRCLFGVSRSAFWWLATLACLLAIVWEIVEGVVR